MSGKLWDVLGKLVEVQSVVFYVSGRLWEAHFVVFYVCGRIWEAQSMMFCVVGWGSGGFQIPRPMRSGWVR